MRRSARICVAPSRSREHSPPNSCCFCRSLQLPPSAHGEQCCSSLGSSKLALLTTLLRWLISRQAGAFASVLRSFVLDELRRRCTISPSRWRVCERVRFHVRCGPRVVCRSRVIGCELGCDHLYTKDISDVPDAGYARLQLARLHSVTCLLEHYFSHPL